MLFKMFKRALKKTRIFRCINAEIKSLLIIVKYSVFCHRYARKREKEIIFPSIKRYPQTILFIGTDERQDNTGFYQALCSVCECVIPFTTFDGKWGQYESGEKKRKEKNYQRLKLLLEEAERNVDIVLMQAWGASFNVDDINKLKKQYGFIVINIDLDSRLIFKKILYFGKQNPGIFGLAPCVDLELVSTREIVGWYRKEGVPAIYFPLASSKSFYHPLSETERVYDVGFIGGNYGLRGEEVKYLINQGINIEARGPGWPLGPINHEKNNLFFNQCKIVLGIGNISYCRNFYNPKLRDYDAPMSGAVYVTNRTPELEYDFKDGEEIILFDSWDEAVQKIKSLLSDDSKMKKIREAAFRAASEKHTYEKQLGELLSKLKMGDFNG